MYVTPTFINAVLHFVTYVQLFKWLLDSVLVLFIQVNPFNFITKHKLSILYL